MKTFFVKTRVLVGSDSLQHLQTLKNKTVLIICDGFLEHSGGLKRVNDFLDSSNVVHIYTDVIPDPPLSSIINGVDKMRQLCPDIVIALGGGSAIDTAKGIIYFARK